MNFCSQCAHPVIFDIPANDNMPRHICPACDTIYYDNPKIVVCTIPYWKTDGEFSILLCRRAIEPRYGFWTLPGGFMENYETTEEAAVRETHEEAGADVILHHLFSLMNLPTVKQVHLFYIAQLKSLAFAPGMETLEARMFTQNEIPWNEISFASTRRAVQLFFADPVKSINKHERIHSLELKHLIYAD